MRSSQRECKLVIGDSFSFFTSHLSSKRSNSRNAIRCNSKEFSLKNFPSFCSVFLGCIVLATLNAPGQEQSPAANPKSPLAPSIHEIFLKDTFRARTWQSAWNADGKSFEAIEPYGENNSPSIVTIDVLTQNRTLLLDLKELTPPGGEEPLSVVEYHWSNDRRKLLIFTNAQRVWRYATRGDYWVYDFDSKKLHQLGADFPEASLLFAKFSPDGKSVGYVHSGNLYLESLESNQRIQLTSGDGKQVISGTFDWVYEEELSLRDGFQFSPDGSRIAFWEINTEGVEMFPLVDNTSAKYPTLKWIAYPKVGTRNPAARIGILNLESQQTQWLAIPGDSRDHYLARMQWIPQTSELLIQQLNRLQNRLTIYKAATSRGTVQALYTETDSCWVDVHDELFWDQSGNRFTWFSEKNGWRQLYWIDAATGNASLVCDANFDILELLHVDWKNQKFLFIASPENATQRYLFSCDFGGRELTRLTPMDTPGTHQYDISPTGEYAIHTSSSLVQPPVTSVISLPDHKTVRVMAESPQVLESIARFELPRPKLIKVAIPSGGEAWGGETIELDAWCYLPEKREGEKVPVIFYVYGEPAGQTVLDRWGGAQSIWHAALAKQGYAVFSIDNRGTPAPRGRLWRKCVYQQIGILASADQAAAVTSILKMYPELDEKRIAIWGWSGGGSMTLNALFRYPEIYQRGVSIAPVPNQLYYDTIYQERYMGLPDSNAEGYRLGSPITFANQLKGELLLIHGTGDDNCHYQTTELLINELVAEGKQFRMFAYPGRSHSISEGEGTTWHLYQMITDFLLEK
jgi:dipeptidyl-peptidase-4